MDKIIGGGFGGVVLGFLFFIPFQTRYIPSLGEVRSIVGIKALNWA
jgi:hypothetical protein